MRTYLNKGAAIGDIQRRAQSALKSAITNSSCTGKLVPGTIQILSAGLDPGGLSAAYYDNDCESWEARGWASYKAGG